jgi:hypothetical protein
LSTLEKLSYQSGTGIRFKAGFSLVYGRYVLGTTSGPIQDWYWYKAGITSGHTQLVGSLIPIWISEPYTQLASYIPVQHWSFQNKNQAFFN